MNCPKCGFEQEERLDCLKCGIVFSRFNSAPVERVERENSVPETPEPEPVQYFAPSSVVNTNQKIIVTVVIVIVLIFLFKSCGDGFVEYGPGEVAPDQPIQTNLQDAEKFDHKGYTFTPAAEFDITSRVLAKKRYRFDGSSELSPFDMTMGWGPMSDEKNLDEIKISQSGRFYHWRTKNFPIPAADIIKNSANMHLIPADDFLFDTMKDVKPGQVVNIKGYLVKITREDGWRWNSSMTRNDSGGGACEVIWVEDIEIVEPQFSD